MGVLRGLKNRRFSLLTSFLVNYGGVLYTLVVIHLITYLTVFVACPESNDEKHCQQLNWVAAFILIQLYVNLGCFQFFSKENNVVHWQRHSVVAGLCKSSAEVEEGKEEEHNPETAGKFCVECNRAAPIRSHHCPLCHQCVLRKDHHCYVVGACVGLGNQRYFIVFLSWALIGTAVGTVNIAKYMNAAIMPWFVLPSVVSPWLKYPIGWLYYIGPVAVTRWLFGTEPLFNVFVCVVFSFSIASFIACLGFLGSQIFYTLQGYTMYEYHSLCIREAFDGDGAGCGERMRLVFGPYWMLNFFIPAVWFKQKLTPEIADNLFRIRSKLL